MYNVYCMQWLWKWVCDHVAKLNWVLLTSSVYGKMKCTIIYSLVILHFIPSKVAVYRTALHGLKIFWLWFSFISILKDAPEPTEPKTVRRRINDRLTMFPTLDYNVLYETLVSLVDIVPLVQYGQFRKLNLNVDDSLMAFNERVNFLASTCPVTALCICVCCMVWVCNCVMVARKPRGKIMQYTHAHKAVIGCVEAKKLCFLQRQNYR